MLKKRRLATRVRSSVAESLRFSASVTRSTASSSAMRRATAMRASISRLGGTPPDAVVGAGGEAGLALGGLVELGDVKDEGRALGAA